MGEKEELTRFLPNMRDQRKSLTPNEKKRKEINEREEHVKGIPQVRDLFSYLRIYQTADPLESYLGDGGHGD